MNHDIDDKFLDVDFEKQPEYVEGCAAEPVGLMKGMVFFDEVIPEMTDSQIEEAIERLDEEKSGLEYMVTRIFNQGREGACVSDACGQAHEMKQAHLFGPENVIHVSAISLYDFIGRTAGSGAMISDGLEEGSRIGFVPLDDEANRKLFVNDDGEPIVMKNTGFKSKRPKGWEAVAKSFRFTERYIIRNTKSLLTAGLMNMPVVVGRRGHSICYTRPIKSNGRIVMPYPNSWDYSWGQAFGNMKGGFGFDSMSNINASASWCFAIRGIVLPKHMEKAVV